MFLFKYSREAQSQASPVQHDVPGLFFARQLINNACATQAILSVLLNAGDDIELGTALGLAPKQRQRGAPRAAPARQRGAPRDAPVQLSGGPTRCGDAPQGSHQPPAPFPPFPGPTLAEFSDFAMAMDPEMRGLAISNSDRIREIHNSFARQGGALRAWGLRALVATAARSPSLLRRAAL